MSGAIFISDDLVLSILLFAISHLQGVPKNVLSIDVFDNLGPLWTYLDTFGPFQTKINLGHQMVKKAFRLTILDPFGPLGPLWNVEKPVMFGHFCLFY